VKKIFLIIILLAGIFAYGQKKQVCFTIDDLPVVSYGISDKAYQKHLFKKLVFSLKQNHIPAIGFVIGRNLYTDTVKNEFQINLLKFWLNKGLDLGNHTYSHPDYNETNLKLYSEDIVKAEPVLKSLLKSKNKTLRYFRHTYLYVGDTKEKADSLEKFLASRKYIAVPVTINTEDYLFALAYKRAVEKKDNKLSKRIGIDYINYMEAKLIYYENQSVRLFNRDISQILLIHASKLNSDYMNELAAVYVKHNYSFVSIDDALKDNAYKTKITVFGKWGLSWIDQWALSQGKNVDFFKDNPQTPEYIKELAK